MSPSVPQSYPCPACPSGTLLISVEMSDAIIYLCDVDDCQAALWVQTDEGRLLQMTKELRLTQMRLAALLKKTPRRSH